MELARFTTLEVGGEARRFVRASTDHALVEEISACDARGEKVFVLGGGSNVVFPDEGFDGIVVRVETRGIVFLEGDVIEIAAGEVWDDFVAFAVQGGRSGVECMSGIPGLAGATPMQNVGAYGQEVKDTLAHVRVWDRQSARVMTLSAAECRMSYRHSMLKESARFVVLRVAFALSRSPESAPIRYAELARALGVAEGSRAPLARVRETVRELRRGKGMVLDASDADTRSAGSFFVNPTMDEHAYQALAARAGEKVPRFDHEGAVKVPAAWLIERAGFAKGTARGHAAISTKHALAITNRGGATAKEIVALAREVRDAVDARFGVRLSAEPILVGHEL